MSPSPCCPCCLRAVRRLGALALLGVVLSLNWSVDAQPGDKPKGGAKGQLNDLKLVPADTAAFVSVRVADLMKSALGKKLLPELRQGFAETLERQEKELGVPLAGIERLTVLVPFGPDRDSIVIVRTLKPFDRDKVLGPQPVKRDVAGKTLYQRRGSAAHVYPAGESVFVLGGPRVSELVKAKPKKAGVLAGALRRAGEKHAVVLGIQPEQALRQEARGRGRGDKERPGLEQLLDDLPPESLPYRPLLEARSVIVTVDVSAVVRVDAELRYADEARAQDGLAAARTALYVGRHLARRGLGKELGLAKVFPQVEQGLKGVTLQRETTTVQASLRLPLGAAQLAALLAVVREQAARLRAFKARLRAFNQLKQLALAGINFADSNNNVLFGPAIYSKDGKPLLSWRVTLLPYLDQGKLYKEFKLDEPWDSPHNKKLLEKMPAVYAPVMGKTKEPYSTYYRIFTGPNTPFDPMKARRGPEGLGGARFPASFPDGTSNTILIVEAAEAVPWTKPDELEFDRKKPLPKLGGQFPGIFLAALADGSVRMIRRAISEETLKNAIDPADGNVLGPDW